MKCFFMFEGMRFNYEQCFFAIVNVSEAKNLFIYSFAIHCFFIIIIRGHWTGSIRDMYQCARVCTCAYVVKIEWFGIITIPKQSRNRC